MENSNHHDNLPKQDTSPLVRLQCYLMLFTVFFLFSPQDVSGDTAYSANERYNTPTTSPAGLDDQPNHIFFDTPPISILDTIESPKPGAIAQLLDQAGEKRKETKDSIQSTREKHCLHPLQGLLTGLGLKNQISLNQQSMNQWSRPILPKPANSIYGPPNSRTGKTTVVSINGTRLYKPSIKGVLRYDTKGVRSTSMEAFNTLGLGIGYQNNEPSHTNLQLGTALGQTGITKINFQYPIGSHSADSTSQSHPNPEIKFQLSNYKWGKNNTYQTSGDIRAGMTFVLGLDTNPASPLYSNTYYTFHGLVQLVPEHQGIFMSLDATHTNNRNYTAIGIGSHFDLGERLATKGSYFLLQGGYNNSPQNPFLSVSTNRFHFRLEKEKPSCSFTLHSGLNFHFGGYPTLGKEGSSFGLTQTSPSGNFMSISYDKGPEGKSVQIAAKVTW